MRRLGSGLTGALRRVDARLHIDHRGRSEWIWAVPLLTVLGTFALLLLVGAGSGTPVPLFVPVALIVALVMGGMSVAYMTPEAEDSEPGDDRRPPHPVPPDTPPEPRPWYERLGGHTVDEPAYRRRTTGRRQR
jgi:hypothetical protein